MVSTKKKHAHTHKPLLPGTTMFCLLLLLYIIVSWLFQNKSKPVITPHPTQFHSFVFLLPFHHEKNKTSKQKQQKKKRSTNTKKSQQSPPRTAVVPVSNNYNNIRHTGGNCTQNAHRLRQQKTSLACDTTRIRGTPLLQLRLTAACKSFDNKPRPVKTVIIVIAVKK